jgi:hypothetical protein
MPKVNPDREWIDIHRAYVRNNVRHWDSKEELPDVRLERERKEEERIKSIITDEVLLTINSKIADLNFYISEVLKGHSDIKHFNRYATIERNSFRIEDDKYSAYIGRENKKRLLACKSKIEFEAIATELIGAVHVMRMEVYYKEEVAKRAELQKTIDNYVQKTKNAAIMASSDGMIV